MRGVPAVSRVPLLHCLAVPLPAACHPYTHPGCYHNKITGDTLHLIVILASNVKMLRDIFVDPDDLLRAPHPRGRAAHPADDRLQQPGAGARRVRADRPRAPRLCRQLSDQDQEAALATLDSLEADFPESVSAVGSIEGCTVSTVSVSGLTTRTSRRGHKKIREAVITATKPTDTATTEHEAVGAGAMIVQLQGLRERCGDTWHNSSAATPFVPASASSRPCVVFY